MDLVFSAIGPGGHTELSFSGRHVRVTWKETSGRERRMIKRMVDRARKRGFEVCTVDDDGRPDRPASAKDLPGLFGKKEGEIILQGAKASDVRLIAMDVVEADIREGNIVMELQDDNTWKKIVKGSFEPKEDKPQKVASTPAIVGG